MPSTNGARRSIFAHGVDAIYIREPDFSHYSRDAKWDYNSDAEGNPLPATYNNKDFQLVDICKDLEKLTLAMWVGCARYRPQQDQEYNISLEPEEVMKGEGLHELFKWTQLKEVRIHGVDEKWYSEWAVGSAFDGLNDLVKHLCEEFKKRKMTTKIIST